MTTRSTLRMATTSLAALAVLGLALESGSGNSVQAAPQSHRHPVVTIGAPLPLPITGSTTVSGTVSVGNLPAVQNVNVVNPGLPVTLARTPVHGGQYFEITQPNAPPFIDAVTLTVPAGVVLTDAHASFSIPENVANAASLIVRDGSDYFVYQIVNNTTFSAGVDLQTGIVSDGNLVVELSCYNIAGNHCQGALMWSGYTTP